MTGAGDRPNAPMSLPDPLPRFETGPARFAVALSPIDPGLWLQPDDQRAWLPGKGALLDDPASGVFAALDGHEGAQRELLDLVAAATGTAPDPVGEPALKAASRRVSDDLVLLVREASGWRVVAASLCAPTYFCADDAVGGSVDSLHRPVPGGSPGLSSRIGRVFDNLQPGLVLERHNWTLQWGDARHTPSVLPLVAAATGASDSAAEAMLHERVERQTIRTLPVSGALVFTIRVRLTPLRHLLDADPGAAQRFWVSWAETADAVRGYKRWPHLERHVRRMLADRGVAV